MRISTAAISRDGATFRRERNPDAGFTLIELSIVVFILAIVTTLAVPRIRDLTGARLSSGARRLSSTALYLSEQSAIRGIPHTLAIDLDKESWQGLRFDPTLGESVPIEGLPGRNFQLPEGIEITDVIHPSLGKITDGVVETHFWPEGWADPTVIHLADTREIAKTIRIHPVRGRGEVYEGYERFESSDE